MIRLSRLADYGVTLMSQLASRPGMLVTAPDLALVTGLPVPTVSKVLKLLAHDSLIVSQRGTKGGYALTRSAGDITVAQIIAALDGPISLTDCMDELGNVCDIEAQCTTRTNWRKINDVINEALATVTLADMMAPDMPFIARANHPAPPPPEPAR